MIVTSMAEQAAKRKGGRRDEWHYQIYRVSWPRTLPRPLGSSPAGRPKALPAAAKPELPVQRLLLRNSQQLQTR